MLCWVLSAGSLVAILGFVLVAVRDVLRRQGFWKGRPLTMSVNMKLQLWCAVDVF